MPFKGTDPLGTSGGKDQPDLPQLPADIRIAEGGSYVGFLVINGPLTERLREQIEQVVRTLGPRGQQVMALIIRDSGAIIDNDATDLDFRGALKVGVISPGVSYIEIDALGITSGMLADALITAQKLANDSVTTDKITDLNVTNAKIANGTIDAATKLLDASITSGKIQDLAITASKMAANSVTGGAIASATINPTKLTDPTPHLPGNANPNMGGANYAATADILTATWNAPVGTYRGFLLGIVNAEGAGGALASGGLEMRLGASVGANYSHTFEAGVNGDGIAMHLFGDSFFNGNQTLAIKWNRTSGSINAYASWILGVVWLVG